MGSANFSCPVTVVSDGDVILASERNAEFTNISTNFNPTGMSGYQDNLAQKQLQEDPATGLVTSLAKELEQLRFAIKRITGETYWYTAPDSDLSTAVVGPGSATDNAVARFDATTGKLVQNSVVTIADDGDTVVGDGTKTTTTPSLTLNSNTGDAGIRLQVNNTSANAWDIFNDNSVNDRLTFAYNGVEVLHLEGGTAQNLQLTGADTPDLVINNTSTGDARIILRVNDAAANQWEIYNDNSDSDVLKLAYNSGGVRYQFAQGSTTDPITFNSNEITTSSTPAANAIYPHNIVKAYASIELNTSATPAINDGFNVDSVSANATEVTVNLLRAMANADYAVHVTGTGSTSNGYAFGIFSRTTTSFKIYIYGLNVAANTVDLVDPSASAIPDLSITVVGRQ